MKAGEAPDMALLVDVGARIWDRSPDLHCIATLDGRLLAVNAAFKKMTGRRWRDLRRIPYLELVHEGDRERVKQQLRSLRVRPVIPSFECRVRTQDGHWLWFEWAAAADLDKGVVFARGRPAPLTGDLATACHQLQAIVESAIDGIITIDEAGMIRSANPAIERTFGYSESELVGRNISILMAEPDRSEHDGYIASYVAGGGPHVIGREREVRGRKKDGTIFFLELGVTEFWLDSGERQFTGILRDVTERRMLEAELRAQSEALAEANEQLRWFTSAASHDLRGPLLAIDGFSGALERDFGDSLGPEGRRRLGRIRAAASKMSRLIDDLLAFSAAGCAEVRTRRCNISMIASQVAREVGEANGGSVELHIEPDIMASADPRLLRQVLMNLLSNAWKFTAPKEKRVVEVGRAAGEEQETFYVKDNGVGFSEEHADALFKPFARLHPGVEFEGSGIGLAIVDRIVRRHGGRVWARGEPGVGATFFFSLPGQGMDGGREVL